MHLDGDDSLATKAQWYKEGISQRRINMKPKPSRLSKTPHACGGEDAVFGAVPSCPRPLAGCPAKGTGCKHKHGQVLKAKYLFNQENYHANGPGNLGDIVP